MPLYYSAAFILIKLSEFYALTLKLWEISPLKGQYSPAFTLKGFCR